MQRAFGGFGQPQQPSAGFGFGQPAQPATTSGAGFGFALQQQQQQQAAAPSPFGAQAQAGAPSPFGAQAQAAAAPSPFGQSAAPSGFAAFATQRPTQPAAGPVAFGSPQPMQLLAFAQQPPPAPPAPASGFWQQQGGGVLSSGGVGFCQPQQAPASGSAGFVFGQQPQQAPASSSAGFGFGQQPQEAPAVAAGFQLGQQQLLSTGPAAPAAGASPFGFGQGASAAGFAFGAQQQPPAVQQSPSPAPVFGAGAASQPASGGFGFVQSSPAAAPPTTTGFGFGQQAPAAATAAGKFDFGASLRKQQPGQEAAAAAGAGGAEQRGRQQGAGGGWRQGKQQQLQPAKKAPGAEGGMEEASAAASTAWLQWHRGEEEEFDYEAAKAAALANLPTFGGGGAGGATAPAAAMAVPPPPAARPAPKPQLRRQGRQAAGLAAGAASDAEEEARRAQRANRFAATIGAGGGADGASAGGSRPPSPQPAMAVGGPGSTAPPRWAAGSRAGEESGPGEGEEDYEGSGVRSGAIVGTCEDMCPGRERERRMGLSDIQIFERVEPNNPNVTSAELAVKRFARTIDDANNKPSDFRTRGALHRTMQYLRGLLDRSNARLGLVHKFLWDRYRSVRQDLYIQGMDDEFGVAIYEEVVRFHVLSEHELCEEEASITDMEGFDSHLNMEQMNKALISLNDMYVKLSQAGRPQPNEAEFRAYHLLTLMAQHGKFGGSRQAFLSNLQSLRPEVRGSPAVQWVLRLQQAFAANNFVRFFALVRTAPYLPACLSHIYFPQVRKRALLALAEALAPPRQTVPVELEWLQSVLMLDTREQAHDLCKLHGFECVVEGDTAVAVLLQKGAFVEPPPPVPRHRSRLISQQAPARRSEAVTTPAMPPLSPAEAAALEQQRQQALLQQRAEAERASAAAAAEARQREQAAAAAAEEAECRRRQRDEARRQEELERQRLEQQRQEQQRQAEAEALRQQLAAERERQAKLQGQQALEAERQRQAEAHQRWMAEQRRLAEEAERQRLEEERGRREAEAAEAARLAELERQRQERQRLLEEQKRKRREAKRRAAVQQLYFARWRGEAHRRKAERAQLQRIAAALKACRVGAVRKEEEAATAALGDLSLDASLDAAAASRVAEEAAPSAAAAAASAGASAASAAVVVRPRGQTTQAPAPAGRRLDLPALVASLLLQRAAPAAGEEALYWKVVLLPGSPGSVTASQRQLLHWLRLHLSSGRVLPLSTGTAFLDGPVKVSMSGASNGRLPQLSTCILVPHSALSSTISSSMLAGASGVIFAAGSPDISIMQQLAPRLPPGMALPLLVLATTAAAAKPWEALAASSPSPMRVVRVEGEHHDSRAGAHSAPQAAAFSQGRLVEGLHWLVSQAPEQPALEVTRLEDVVRDALATLLQPLEASPGLHLGVLAAQQYAAAFSRAVALVAEAIRQAHASPVATWAWPPPELAPQALRRWHGSDVEASHIGALQALRLEPAALLPYSSTPHQLSVAAHLRLAALEGQDLPPLVLPAPVAADLRRRLALAAAELAAVTAQQQQQPDSVRASAAGGSLAMAAQAAAQARSGSPSAPRQKRKWQPPALVPAAVAAAALPRAPLGDGSSHDVPEGAGGGLDIRSPDHTRLRLFTDLQRQLEVEWHREQRLQRHAVTAVALPTEAAPAVALPNGSINAGALAAEGEAAHGGSDPLARLRALLLAEKTAVARLACEVQAAVVGP